MSPSKTVIKPESFSHKQLNNDHSWNKNWKNCIAFIFHVGREDTFCYVKPENLLAYKVLSCTKKLDQTQSDWWWLDFCFDLAAVGECGLFVWAVQDIQTLKYCAWRACSSDLMAWGQTRRSHDWVHHHCRCAGLDPVRGAYLWDPAHTGL